MLGANIATLESPLLPIVVSPAKLTVARRVATEPAWFSIDISP